MIKFNPTLHVGTPAVAVVAGLGSRSLSFLRHPDTPDNPARILITRGVQHLPTRSVRLFGARALRGADGQLVPDATTVTALDEQVTLLFTADGDATFNLADAAGRTLWTRSPQGTVKTFVYEPTDSAGRLLTVSERAADGVSRIRDRLEYAVDGPEVRAYNLAGAAVRQYDNAGYTDLLSVSLTGQPRLTQLFLLKHDASSADWQQDILTIETDPPLALNVTYDATGVVQEQTNAAGVTSLTALDVSGALYQSRLRYMPHAGKGDKTLTEVLTLRDIQRAADGVILSQTAGNGVQEEYNYEPQTRRLARHLTQRPPGHQLGPLIIADLHYDYEPAGNILRLDDQGADPRWHNNHQAAGLRTYAYDTLYRLTSATGRERMPASRRRGPCPARLADSSAGRVWSPYTEHYSYDDGDNLITTAHVGAASQWTRSTTLSARSNRGVSAQDNTLADPHDAYLAGGLRKALDDGRALTWHADGQLQQVSPVVRFEEDDDRETYRYSDPGTRVRKVRTCRTSGGVQTTVTTYAAGIETRVRTLTETQAPLAEEADKGKMPKKNVSVRNRR